MGCPGEGDGGSGEGASGGGLRAGGERAGGTDRGGDQGGEGGAAAFVSAASEGNDEATRTGSAAVWLRSVTTRPAASSLATLAFGICTEGM